MSEPITRLRLQPPLSLSTCDRAMASELHIPHSYRREVAIVVTPAQTSLLASVFLLSFTASPSVADPIRAPAALPTTGHLVVERGGITVFHHEAFAGVSMFIAGDGFSIGFGSGDQFHAPSGASTSFGLVDPSFDASGFLDPVGRSVQIAQQLVQLRNFACCEHTLGFSVTAPPSQIPPADDPFIGFDVTYPFLLTGRFHIVSAEGIEYDFHFTGTGTGTTSFFGPFERGSVSRHRSELAFDGIEPVPEPTTLLLLATGGAAFGRRVWNRRQRKS